MTALLTTPAPIAYRPAGLRWSGRVAGRRLVGLVARAVGLGLVAVVVGLGTVVGAVLFAPAAAAPVPVPVATAGNSARTPLATRYADNRAAMLAYGAPYAGWATGDRQFLLF